MQIRNWPYSKTDITNQKMRWFNIWSGIRPTLMTQMAKNLPAMQETRAQSLGGEGDGYPLQYSSLENPKDRGAWYATVHGITRARHDQVTNTLYFINVSFQFNHSVVSDSLRPCGLQHVRLPCPSPTSRGCSNSCPSSRWCHPNI